MWSWDQGRLDYFQFDEIRKIAKFAVSHDLKAVSVDEIGDAVGLPFLPKKDGYKPWRNYSRTFKLAKACDYQTLSLVKAYPSHCWTW